MNVREITEKIERETLSPFAALSENTKGREKPLEPCDLRTEYQRDRDRIIHSKAFRRLKHKTQVFITPEGDHYRTRLTHTLEVAQIARTICRALRLNEDLVEAMALGHDLGHTPFGHAGEQALDEISPFGFAHYEQSVRVVEKLENGGMNLTFEVKNGIANHTGDQIASTLEGIVLKFADRIAYINHDIDDAIRGKIISNEMIPEKIREVLGNTHSDRIDTMIRDIVSSSAGKNEILMTQDVGEAMQKLRTFMFEQVYVGSKAKIEEAKVYGVVEALYNHFISHPDEMPQEYRSLLSEDPIERVVCDYIAGMSDRYALFVYQHLFVPHSWNKF